MSTVQLKELVESIAVSQKETDRQMKETDRQLQETGRQIKELGRQIGGLGNKFGTFTEGLAFGSIKRILRDEFGMETVSPAVGITRGDQSEEFDVLAYSNGGANCGVVVEVKSLLDMRTVAQMKRKMDRLFEWLPEHRDKEFVGMVAFVKAHSDARAAVLAEGWYLAEVGDDLFRMITPETFRPRIYRSQPAG